MVLLDLLVKQAHSSQLRAKSSASSLELIVAHFNHGIRPDSAEDEKLVRNTAKKHGLKFEAGQGKLGAGASEAKARAARYKFLESVKNKHKALSIITAHHQDDLIETAFINMLRGTGRQGLSAITSNENVTRPLLHVTKKQIREYAKKHKIIWREDTTNKSDAYLRNYLRSQIMSKLKPRDKKLILNSIDKAAATNKILNSEIATLSHNLITNSRLNRRKFIMLPNEVADDVIMAWFRSQGFRSYDRKTVIRTRLSIKTALPKTSVAVSKGLKLVVGRKDVSLVSSDKNA